MNRRTQTATRSMVDLAARRSGESPLRPLRDRGFTLGEAPLDGSAPATPGIGPSFLEMPLVESVRPLGQATPDGSPPSRPSGPSKAETSVEELLGPAPAPAQPTVRTRPERRDTGGFAGSRPTPSSRGNGAGSVGALAVAEQLVIVDDDDPELGSDATRKPLGTAGFARAWRLQAVPDINGPRVRLGLLWFVVAGIALTLGAWTAALVLAPVAAVGAVQTGAALRKAGGRAQPLVAGAAAAAVVVAGVAPSSRVIGLAVLVALAASLISGLHVGGFDLVSASSTVRAWLGVALAGVAPVVMARFEPALAVLALLLVCSYDAGDFLVGSAASTVIEGPLAGVVAVLAVGCGALALHPASLSNYRLWPAVVLTALACPIGQLIGSATLPRAGAFAPGLRRLDSLILSGPLWLLLFG